MKWKFYSKETSKYTLIIGSSLLSFYSQSVHYNWRMHICGIYIYIFNIYIYTANADFLSQSPPPVPQNCQKATCYVWKIQPRSFLSSPRSWKKKHLSKVTWQKSAIWPLPCYKDSHWPRLLHAKGEVWVFLCSLKCWKSNFWEHGALDVSTSSFIWLCRSNQGDFIR